MTEPVFRIILIEPDHERTSRVFTALPDHHSLFVMRFAEPAGAIRRLQDDGSAVCDLLLMDVRGRGSRDEAFVNEARDASRDGRLPAIVWLTDDEPPVATADGETVQRWTGDPVELRELLAELIDACFAAAPPALTAERFGRVDDDGHPHGHEAFAEHAIPATGAVRATTAGR